MYLFAYIIVSLCIYSLMHQRLLSICQKYCTRIFSVSDIVLFEHRKNVFSVFTPPLWQRRLKTARNTQLFRNYFEIQSNCDDHTQLRELERFACSGVFKLRNIGEKVLSGTWEAYPYSNTRFKSDEFLSVEQKASHYVCEGDSIMQASSYVL